MSRWSRSFVLAVVPLVVLGLASGTPAAAALPIVPLLDCVTYDASTSTLTAQFGYVNPNTQIVNVNLGPNNYFAQAPNFRSQPVTFLPGTNHQVFQTTISPPQPPVPGWVPELDWFLEGVTVTATATSTPYCSSPATGDASLTMPGTATTPTDTDVSLTATVTDPSATTSGGYGTLIYTLPTGLDVGTLPAGSTCTSSAGEVVCPHSTEGDQTLPVRSAVPGVYEVTGTYVPAQFVESDAANNVATTSVRVAGTPTAVTGLAGAVTGTGAELAGSANPAGSDTTGAFSYWPDGHPDLAATAGSADIGDGFAAVPLDAVLTGLAPGTTYDYQATATDGDVRATGAQRSFTTLPAAARSAGLSVTASAPAVAAVGDALTQTFTVADAGPSDATGVQLLVHLADQLTSVSAVPGAGTCAVTGMPAVVTCDLGTVVAGSSVPVTVTSTAGTTGTLLAVGTVAGNEPDPSAADNMATTSVTVNRATVSGADLSVRVTGPATSRGPITYTVTVRNAGPRWARDGHLALSTAHGRVTSVSSRGHHCWAGSAPGCVLGGLRPGGVVRITVKVAPQHIGPVTLTATVHSDNADPDPADNQGSFTTRAR